MTSICIYGSVARKDQDRLSDKDALILFDGSAECKDQISRWKANNWSVATYTPIRLQKMADAGSLFVQHLKQEGLIVEDSTQVLSQILATYQPCTSYRSEIEKSMQGLALLEHVPQTVALEYWSADVLHVLIRNIGLLRLANEGVYLFSFQEIAKKLIQLKILHESDLYVFNELRMAKAAYREHKIHLKPLGQTIDNALRIVERLCGATLERSNTLDMSMPRFDQSYFNLRSIEKVLLSYMGLPTGARRLSQAEARLWAYIQDPRAYSWSIKAGQKENWELLLSIVSEGGNRSLPYQFLVDASGEPVVARRFG